MSLLVLESFKEMDKTRSELMLRKCKDKVSKHDWGFEIQGNSSYMYLQPKEHLSKVGC